MDRQTVYSGEIPRSFDILQQAQSSMVALSKMMEAVLGTSGFVDGFALTPTIPASLSLNLAAGQVYQLASLEATNWSSLPADTTHQILKQGISLNSQSLTFAAPGTAGFSQWFLIEVQYADQDTNAIVLPYFNNGTPFPQPPLNGPGGSNTPQNTTRKGIAAVQVKAGIAAPTGTQIAPSPDAGWIGLWLVNIANGQSTITVGSFIPATPTSVPYIAPKLPQVPAYIQNGAPNYARDVGSANAIVATLTPNQGALIEGTELKIKIAADNTSATTATINGVVYPVVHGDLTALVQGDLKASQVALFFFDGASLQIVRSTVDPTSVFQTGDPIWRPITQLMPKFVRMNGLTIGNALSGATERANQDCLALFIFNYMQHSDAICPVSGGRSGSTITTATNDFNANKTIRMLDMRFRGAIGTTTMGSGDSGRHTGATFTTGDAFSSASVGGEAAHTLTGPELAAHTHANVFVDPGHAHANALVDPGHSHGNSITQAQFALGSSSGVTLYGTSLGGGAPSTLVTANTTGITITNASAVTGGSITNASAGGNGAHNNMGPFMTGTWYQHL